MLRRFVILLVFLSAVVCTGLVWSSPVGAQGGFLDGLNEQLEAGGEGAGLISDTTTATDPRIVVAGIIQTVLKILGVLFVMLLVTGGYRLIKANGDEGKVEQAKNTIQAAVIGLIIILMAYSISYFVGCGIQNAVNRAAGLPPACNYPL